MRGATAARVSRAPLSSLHERVRGDAKWMRSHASSHSFSINGRFLSQQGTGVQRYARRIVEALDALMSGGPHGATLLMPRNSKHQCYLETIESRRCGYLQGHLWEQLELPLARTGPLLSLCNTAPMGTRNRAVCIHDTNVFDMPSAYSRSFRSLYSTLQPLISRRATVITTVSKYSASRIAYHLGIPLGKIVVVPNGHEHALEWVGTRSALRGRLDLFRRPFVLLLGSQSRHKNIDRIIGLADFLDGRGLDIVIAGGAGVVFASNTLTTKPNVVVLGRVDDDDLAFLLQNALCLVFPSLMEGFGLPLLEAMVWGCPIVAARSTSIPEVCGDAALFADPRADGEWIEMLSAIHASLQLRKELVEKGRVRVRGFSWSTSAAQYLEMMVSS